MTLDLSILQDMFPKRMCFLKIIFFFKNKTTITCKKISINPLNHLVFIHIQIFPIQKCLLELFFKNQNPVRLMHYFWLISLISYWVLLFLSLKKMVFFPVLLKHHWHTHNMNLRYTTWWLDLYTSWNDCHNRFSEQPSSHMDTTLKK